MSPELYRLGKQLSGFLAKHHVVLFISVIGILLAAGIFTMYTIVQTTFVTPPAGPSSIPDFNQKTIERIRSLQDSTISSGNVTLPSPRPNPFTE